MSVERLTQDDQAHPGQARRDPDPWDSPCPRCGHKSWPRWRGRYTKVGLELKCVKCGFRLRV
jgi:hypothetical protein